MFFLELKVPTTTTNPQEDPTEVYKTQQERSQTPQSSSWHPLEHIGPPQDLIGSPNTWEMLILEPLAPDTTMDLKLLYSERDFWAEEPVLSRASLRMRFTWFSNVCRSVLPGVGSNSLLWAFSMTCHPTKDPRQSVTGAPQNPENTPGCLKGGWK